jgi:hypothetical protein
MRFFTYLNRFRQVLPSQARRQRLKKVQHRPGLEQLEDRLALSTAFQSGPTLLVHVDPGRSILLKADLIDHTKLDVFEKSKLLGQFSIPTIKAAIVIVHGNDAINVDNSNGFPFRPGANIALVGTGANSSFNLKGSQAVFGNELYSAGTATQLGLLQVDFTTFRFSRAIASVDDELANNSSGLHVIAPGQAVTLSGSGGLTERLSGLAGVGGGGGTLTFAHKRFVGLELHGNNATVTLNATGAATGQKFLFVDVFGVHDTVNINATPSTVFTDVFTFGPGEIVNLRGNSGTVAIGGNKSDGVFLGSNDTDFSKSVTSGIQANVFVTNSFVLDILNGGDTTTKEQVKVTESAVSGTGLFGNNSVQLSYSSTRLEFFNGQLANTYTVAASHSGALFNDEIALHDEFSNAGLSVQVNVDSGSNLLLHLFNQDPKTGSLSISAPGGQFHPAVPFLPTGNETVTFTGGLTSEVDYIGFDTVGLSS